MWRNATTPDGYYVDITGAMMDAEALASNASKPK